MKLSAAILAGGHSRRMGRDKALLAHAVHGTLLQRQLHIISQLNPSELLLSCRRDQTLPVPTSMRRVHDAGTQGPLAGLAALLAAATGDFLLVLGVDLGRVTPEFLGRLAAAALTSRPHKGFVPKTSRGLEPLAAIYPTSLASDARRRLDDGRDLSVQGFVRAALVTGDLDTLDVPLHEESLLANWNSPDDLLHDVMS